MRVIAVLFFCVFPLSQCGKLYVNHKTQRTKLLEEELKMSTGGKIVLSDKESKLNKMLMQWKFQELDAVFNNSKNFNFSRRYVDYKDDIKRSKVYQFIKAMPKGAALHVHSSAIHGPDYTLKLTYKNHLYVCFDNILKFQFSYVTPKSGCSSAWKLMKDVRSSVNDVKKFDMELKRNFTLAYFDSLDVTSIWKRFQNIFVTIFPLYTYKPVWHEAFYDALKKFRDDNVMYLEIRSSIPKLYELDGTQYNEMVYMNVTNSVVQSFVKDYPDFIGAKMICSFSRAVDAKQVEKLLALTKKSKRMFPNFVAGFDLVGQEDKGKPLVDFISKLEASKHDLDYFFHAGETNWYGTATDANLADAVMLGSKRIGHAFALIKHPLIAKEVKRRDIGLEVSVVSNNMLNLVKDMRNHPLATLISQDMPIVLSSDDPGFWGAEPLSTDFYVAFMGIASRLHDLRFLKQLALNSLRYSSLSDADKKRAYKMFDKKWKKFVDSYLN